MTKSKQTKAEEDLQAFRASRADLVDPFNTANHITTSCTARLIGNAKTGFGVFRAWTVEVVLPCVVYRFEKSEGDILAREDVDGLAAGEHQLVLNKVVYSTQQDAPFLARQQAEVGFRVIADALRKIND